MQTKSSNKVDMCNGPLLPSILKYTVPFALTGILQLFYSAVNMIIVGKRIGHSAFAAVSATGTITYLIVGAFASLSTGIVSVAGRSFGSKNSEQQQKSISTTAALSIVCGLIVSLLGILLSKPLIYMMNYPDDVFPLAVTYVRIYFLGTPGLFIYSFGIDILHAAGDSRRPFLFFNMHGVFNIALNLFFVATFNLGVRGYSLALTISQYFLATIVVFCLLKEKGSSRLILSKIHFHKYQLCGILKIGIPAGFQTVMISVSGIVIQSAINQLGSVTMAGSGTAASVEGFIYIVATSFYQATLAFTAQNYGAKKADRILKVLINCITVITVITVFLGGMILLFRKPLLGLYTNEATVVAAASRRLKIIIPFCAFYGISQVFFGHLSALGYSVLPTIFSLVGSCFFSIGWIHTVLRYFKTAESVYWLSPVSWTILTLSGLICCLIVRPRVRKNIQMISETK